MKDLNWIDDIDDLSEVLDKDTRLIAKTCGIDVLKTLWQHVPGVTLYISERGLNEARKRYIWKHADGSNTHELCVKLGVSESFVYKAMQERARRNAAKQERKPDLFS
jgi:Mor family transcriptional regulator